MIQQAETSNAIFSSSAAETPCISFLGDNVEEEEDDDEMPEKVFDPWPNSRFVFLPYMESEYALLPISSLRINEIAILFSAEGETINGAEIIPPYPVLARDIQATCGNRGLHCVYNLCYNRVGNNNTFPATELVQVVVREKVQKLVIHLFE